MADKVTELHMIGDDVAFLVMIEEGLVQSIFADYLIVTHHNGEALMVRCYIKPLL